MTNSFSTLLLGSHMSIAGGLEQALYRGASIGCTTIQIFTHSNRQWTIKDITDQQINQFKKAKKVTNIYEVVSHSSYLINLCSQSPLTVEKSVETLKKELIHCEQLEIPYLVLHPGSGGKDTLTSCQQIISNINKILDSTAGKTILLLETMAGQGSCVGYTFEQLGHMIKNIKQTDRIGICLDTCHIFAAGYDFSTPENYQAMWKEFDTLIGLEKLKVIHLNNSKKPLGSRVDRHEHIDKGLIKLKAFELLMNDPSFKNIPKILETPKSKSLQEDKDNMSILKSLIRMQ